MGVLGVLGGSWGCLGRVLGVSWEGLGGVLGGLWGPSWVGKGSQRQAKTGQDRPRQSKISQVKLSQVVDVKSTVNYKEKCSPAARRQHFSSFYEVFLRVDVKSTVNYKEKCSPAARTERHSRRPPCKTVRTPTGQACLGNLKS